MIHTPAAPPLPPALPGTPSAAPLERDTWHGWLTVENAAAVAERLFCMLDGRHYTMVSVYEYRAYRPEVRTSQRLIGPVRMTTHDSGSVGMQFEDGHYVWGLTARIADQNAAASAAERDRVRIGFTGDRLDVEEFTPEGRRVFWTVAVEDHTD